MGPNNQLARQPPIDYKSATRPQKSFISENGITVALNYKETEISETPRLISGSYQGLNVERVPRPKEPKNGRHRSQPSRQYKKIFTCGFCGYVTDRRNNLARHVSTMHDTCKQLLECCGMRFESKATFRHHINECHKEGYSCSVCGHNFHRKALLKRHLSIHSGRKEFTCSECNYGTSHKSNLERHKKVHSKEVQHLHDDDDDDDDKNLRVAKESSALPPLALGQYAEETVRENPRTPSQLTTAASDFDLPLKKRHLRLSESTEPVSQTKQFGENTWADRMPVFYEQSQPLNLQTEQRKHRPDLITNVDSNESYTNLPISDPQAFPMHLHAIPAVPWTLLTPFYAYRTAPQVSYPNMFSVDLSPSPESRPLMPSHHWGRRDGPTNEKEETEQGVQRDSRNRIMATPYKCFECNSRFSSQLSLALHLQSSHPMADVVTLSIVTVLNNMNKLKRNKLNGSNSAELQYQREELQQFLTET